MNDHWTIYAVGFLAQILFSGRTLHQWLLSEKKEKVVTPTLFWTLGLAAAFLLLGYGFLRDDFALILGQFVLYYIYIRNLQIKNVWKNYSAPTPWLIYIAPMVLIGVVATFGYNWEELFSRESIPIWLLIVGIIGQITYVLRFVYQWYYSEKEDESTLPLGFWLLSFLGSSIILVYGIYRRDPVLIAGHFFGLFTYVRNAILLKRYKNNS